MKTKQFDYVIYSNGMLKEYFKNYDMTQWMDKTINELNLDDTAAYTISLVVVFPTLPVIPIKGISNFDL